ncbi:MAG TPA: transporter substrate-binding domain-containing protein [Stellaceae bacterium]|nr:transporter substrate-binding domain-containing protein [Stellaceae bacterium]
MIRIGSILLIAAAALALAGQPAQALDPLTVCLETNTPPFSYHDGPKTGGFDVAVSAAVAKRLGRDLKIQWFEIRDPPDEDDPDPGRAENAMLNAGKCQLVGGFPLIANDLAPAVDKSRLPDFTGITRPERKEQVPIGKLIASKPYHYLAFTVLLGPKAAGRKIATLADLDGLRIGSEDGTLADAILMWYGHRRYFRQIVHYTPAQTIDHGGGLLAHLERGDVDATLVELRRYDVYRAEHPDTKIRPSGFYDRIGFNMGFVAAARETALIGEVDGAIDDLMAKNELPAMAEAAGMTYVAPRPPAIAAAVSMGDLMGGD